ncbi:hypothetical protein V8J88_21340 [Massilia sp. W12]|uniref:hypothetical protein n=1 Tax=Massilia sp. W12 TaxID=3126507 RepID=UPI0030D36DA6
MKKIIFGMALIAASTSAFAEDFKTMVIREAGNAMNSGGKVVVFFQTDKPLAQTTAIISAAMKTSNPNAIINKRWVEDVTFKGYDEKKRCGIAVGKWAPGAIESEWESAVYPKVKKSVNIISFQYVKNGDLKTLSGTQGSNGDDIMELCLN